MNQHEPGLLRSQLVPTSHLAKFSQVPRLQYLLSFLPSFLIKKEDQNAQRRADPTAVLSYMKKTSRTSALLPRQREELTLEKYARSRNLDAEDNTPQNRESEKKIAPKHRLKLDVSGRNVARETGRFSEFVEESYDESESFDGGSFDELEVREMNRAAVNYDASVLDSDLPNDAPDGLSSCEDSFLLNEQISIDVEDVVQNSKWIILRLLDT